MSLPAGARGAWRRPWAHYVGTASLTALLTVWSLQLTKMSLRDPYTYWGDALAVGAHFKTVIETGWYESQPRLGAPAGQTYHDFPTADNLHLVAARILSVFTDDWVLAVNLYFIAGFVLASVSALYFLRRVGVSPWMASALAVLYALAPYHFVRGVAHLWLASYYAVPLGAALLVAVLRGEAVWGWGKGGRVRRVILSPTARTIVFLGLLAASSTYYAVFFLLMLALAGIAAWVRDRVWQRFVAAVSLGVVTVGWMVINMLPDTLYAYRNGPNPEGLERSAGEAEIYALKFTQLVLPWAGHRIDYLAAQRSRYDGSYVVLGEPPALGAIAAFGFVAAFIVVGFAAVSRIRARTAEAELESPASPRATLGALSFLVLVAFMFASVGGVSTLISFLTPNLRGWNRMSIDIAILSLGITGLLLDMAVRWLRGLRITRSWGKALPALAAAAVLAVGVFDQTPQDPSRDYAANAAAYASDQSYFEQVEASLPSRAQVLVQPYVRFPEGNAESGLLASSQLIPYLNTDEIRWTAGGIKGRPSADWPGTLRFYPEGSLATLAVLSGSDAILVDREAYVDRGAAVEAELAATPGIGDAFVSGSGRFALYSLADVDVELAGQDTADLRDRITEPVIAYLDEGSSPVSDTLEKAVNQINGGPVSISLVNDSDSERTIELSVTFEADGGSSAVALVLPDGTRVEGTVGSKPITLSATIVVPSGGAHVTIDREAFDPTAPVAVAFSLPRTTDVEVSQALATALEEAS